MKITPGNATPNIVCILYCVPGILIILMVMRLTRKKEKKVVLPTRHVPRRLLRLARA